jgi:hypothetical protein
MFATQRVLLLLKNTRDNHDTTKLPSMLTRHRFNARKQSTRTQENAILSTNNAILINSNAREGLETEMASEDPPNKPPTDNNNWGNNRGDDDGDEGSDRDGFSGSLFVPLLALGSTAVLASVFAKIARDSVWRKERELKNEREKDLLEKKMNAANGADSMIVNDDRSKNKVYVGKRQDEERKKYVEALEKRESANANINQAKTIAPTPTQKVATGEGNHHYYNNNNEKPPPDEKARQSAEELMADAMRHYVDLETEKKENEERERRALEQLLKLEDEQKEELKKQQQSAAAAAVLPPPTTRELRKQQEKDHEMFDIPTPMRGQTHEDTINNTRNPRLMRALSLAADARSAADRATEAAEAAAYAAAELQATLVNRDGPPLNRERFRREFRQRLARNLDDDDQQNRERSGRYTNTSRSNASSSYRRSLQRQREQQTKTQKVLEQTEGWMRNTFLPNAKKATIKTVEFAREKYPSLKANAIKGVNVAKKEAEKIRKTEKFKKVESFVLAKSKEITKELERVAKKTERKAKEYSEDPAVIVDEIQKGASDLAKDASLFFETQIAPIVVQNPELVDVSEKNKNKKNNNDLERKKREIKKLELEKEKLQKKLNNARK